MIVWVNGPFGVGKTTLARALVDTPGALPGATLVDPEAVGFLLRSWTPPGREPDDFQDLAAWRRGVRALLSGLVADHGGPFVVPMTLLHPPYADEVLGGLRADGVPVRHLCLTASPEELAARVTARAAACPAESPDDGGAWCHARNAAYAGVLATLREGETRTALGPADVVDTRGRDADAVLARARALIDRPGT